MATAGPGAPRPLTPLEWLLLIFLGGVWGSSFFFAKLALAEVGPLTIVAARILIAAAVLGAVAALGPRVRLTARHCGDFLVMGLLNNLVPFTLIFWAMYHIPSGLAAVLNSTTPMFTVVLAHFIAGERLTAPRLLGAVCGVVGVGVMVGTAALHGLGDTVLAQLAVLGAALCYAANAFYARRVRDLPPLVSSAGMVTATLLLALPLALWRETPQLDGWPSAAVVWSLLALGLVSTALAYVLYFRLLATAGATNVMLVTFLIPLSALALGIAVLGERLAARHFLGFALIMVGLLLIDGRILARLRAKKNPA